MGKKTIAIIFVIVIVAVAGLIVGLNSIQNDLQPTPAPMSVPTPTVSPSPTPSPTPIAELKKTWFDFITLDSNGPYIRGYLTKGGWNNGCIANATIEIVDTATGTVIGQTRTLSEMDVGKNLNVGGFSYSLPSGSSVSVQAVFHGDSEWKGCTSIVVTYNPYSSPPVMQPMSP